MEDDITTPELLPSNFPLFDRSALRERLFRTEAALQALKWSQRALRGGELEDVRRELEIVRHRALSRLAELREGKGREETAVTRAPVR